MTVLTLASLKGGVGKTTAAVTFAHLASESGQRVVLWDLDPQASSTHVLRIGQRPPGGARRLFEHRSAVDRAIVSSQIDRLDVVPADFSLRHLDLELERLGRPRRRIRRVLRSLGERYDLVVVDCPPGIGLSVDAALRASDLLLVPVVPTELPLRGYKLLVAYVAGEKRLADLELFGFVSMVDGHNPRQREVAAELTGQRGILSEAIPVSVAAQRMVTAREPLTKSEPDSPAARAYRKLWAELGERTS